MHTGRSFLIIAATMLALASVPAARVAAAGTSLQICNQTSSQITVAVSYPSSGNYDTATTLTGPTVSVGWWAIAANQCNSMANPFSARYMYWWGYNNDGALWTSADQSYHFCVPNIYSSGAGVPQFTFEDQNVSEDACTSATAADTYGANMWVQSREVDVDVNATIDYDGQ